MRAAGLPPAARLSLALLLGLVLGSELLLRAGWSLSLQLTASMPRGLYLIVPARRYSVGDVVLLDPPAAVAALMIERGWIGSGMKLMKRIVAAAGDAVCLRDGTAFVNGRPLAAILDRDRAGARLPQARLCRRLLPDEFFLLGSRSPGSFDSRYFGPVTLGQLQGAAIRL